MVLTAKTYILKSLSLQYDPNHVNLTNKHFSWYSVLVLWLADESEDAIYPR